MSKENVTERLAAARQTKYNQLWSEMLAKLAELNQVLWVKKVRRKRPFFSSKNLVKELEQIARQCNSFYEQGNEGEDLFWTGIFIRTSSY